MELASVFDHIDTHFEHTVEELKSFCRQPSVSADGRGIHEMAALVKKTFADLGARVEEHGHAESPVIVVAKLAGRRSKRLVFYNHYDVQPPEPLEPWRSDPFDPVIVDGRVYARGTADNKGSLVARIAALRAFSALYGEQPIDVVYVAEGEEESGSKLLRTFVPQNADLFQADGVIWEEASADQHGNPVMRLGNKGMLHVELSTKGPANDIHSRFGGIFPNPVWKLVWAAATIRGRDGRVLVDGFLDDITPPLPGEVALYQSLSSGTGSLLARHGVAEAFPLQTDYEVMETLYHMPTCNISGIAGGYAGPGTKTIIPGSARMRIDFRLVPQQTPGRILELLRIHLDKHGFADVELRALNSHTPAKTPLTDSFARLVAETAEVAYGRPVTVEPTSSGTGPRHLVTAVSGVPIVAIGASYAGSMIHGPNENIRLDDLRGHAKHVAAIMLRMAESSDAATSPIPA